MACLLQLAQRMSNEGGACTRTSSGTETCVRGRGTSTTEHPWSAALQTLQRSVHNEASKACWKARCIETQPRLTAQDQALCILHPG